MELNTAFDFATMIYCDYGALSTDDRKTLMQNVYSHLKSGGKFLLDVFSTEKYNSFLQTQTWEVCNNGGFWSNEKYVAFYGNYKYAPNVTLEQASIIKDSGVFQYYIWNTYFTKETFINEAQEAGFKLRGVWVSDGELREKQTANYFSDIYPIDCAVLSANAQSYPKCCTLLPVLLSA